MSRDSADQLSRVSRYGEFQDRKVIGTHCTRKSMKWNAHLMIFYRPKYAALGNNFADAEDAGEALEAIGCEKQPMF